MSSATSGGGLFSAALSLANCTMSEAVRPPSYGSGLPDFEPAPNTCACDERYWHNDGVTHKDGGVALDLVLAGKGLVHGGIDSTELGHSLELCGGLVPLGRKVLAVSLGAHETNEGHTGDTGLPHQGAAME